jgi:hypothetical protein
MQEVFGTPVTSANKLNCTANDIRLSKAIRVSPTSCIAGSTFDLDATFEVQVTANSRYDAGFFFRIDGGDNARGDGVNAAGTCSLSALTPPPPPNEPALELDGDTCGDLNSGTYEVTFVIPDVLCEAAPGTDQLKLPNCTSWHSNAGTACSVSDPDFVATDAVYFHPDTKSKCVCDDTFTVPVTVEDAALLVTKTADPTQLPEPGGTVTYTVDIQNVAGYESVVIKTIKDSLFGDIGTNVNGYDPNTCVDLIDDTLAPGATISCYFSATHVDADDGDHIVDIVTVTAYQPSKGTTIEGQDDAAVDITGVYTAPTVTKTAQSTVDCKVDVIYQVVVNNNSAVDSLTVDSLTDDLFGDITVVHGAGAGYEEVLRTTCGLPKADIVPLGNMTCQFKGRILGGTCEISHTNTVTAGVTDDDGETAAPTDYAIVTLTTTP